MTFTTKLRQLSRTVIYFTSAFFITNASRGLSTPFTNPQQVAAGNSHTCVIDDNGVQCWGYNGGGL